jgi:hypothetical protein
MHRTLKAKEIYRISAPENLYKDMRADVKLLHSHKAYASLTTIIMCCIDALAAGSGTAGPKCFYSFVEKHFPDLCTALDPVWPGRKGSHVLYDKFRNGFAHKRGPKLDSLIMQDYEVMNDCWAEKFNIDTGGQAVGLNVDRLAREFLTLLDRLEEGVLKAMGPPP